MLRRTSALQPQVPLKKLHYCQEIKIITKINKSHFSILAAVAGLCLLLSACSGVAASVETDLGTLELGRPYNRTSYGPNATTSCIVPVRWADNQQMSDYDLNYIIQSGVSLRSQGEPRSLANMPLTFADDPWEWALAFGDCNEGHEVFLNWPEEEAISLGELE